MYPLEKSLELNIIAKIAMNSIKKSPETASTHQSTIDILFNKTSVDEEDISNVVFTLTDDIDCVYPAKIAREEFPEWKYVPMVCFNELKIQKVF